MPTSHGITPAGIRGPFPFGPRDLEPGRLDSGVRHTLAHFRAWRDAHAGTVADHVERHTAHVAEIRARYGLRAVVRQRMRSPRRDRAERERMAREAVHFGVYNMAEVLEPAIVDAVVDGVRGRVAELRGIAETIDERHGVAGVVESLERRLPILKRVDQTRWLAERLDRLHRMLPEQVVGGGGMGKVVRTVAGVLTIGVYDTLDLGPADAAAHLTRILPGAYAYGAVYAIVDDTLHDLPDAYLSPDDRRRCHEMIVRGLGHGEPADPAGIPDHPLADELHELHALLLEIYPFDRCRHLYHAAESMYLAQHRDASRPASAPPVELSATYPDMFVKAAMSRVVANVLARRSLEAGFYPRCVNTIFLSQLRDDLIDLDEDSEGGRLTPFTFPAGRTDANPLYDLFAYNAYVASQVYGDLPVVADALAYYSAARLARYLSTHPGRADLLARRYEATPEIDRFLHAASGMPKRALDALDVTDQRLKKRVGGLLGRREPTTVDCRTFVSDRLAYINDVTARYCGPATAGQLDGPATDGQLDGIVAYAIGGPGKRLRPALTLMLAAGLGVEPAAIEPMLAAGELFHTASLLFDDLPAQDDATVRRGRPAAHLVFDEGSVQLAAISMISTGFGLLARMDRRFPAHRVTDVIAYVGTALGPGRMCLGQHVDLRMGRDGSAPTQAAILRMYDLKTSTGIEAALVPLMMVLDRPAEEIALVKRYAHHTGIVFQIRDDMLDVTSSAGILGKNVRHDATKTNLVSAFGIDAAAEVMRRHLGDAVECCDRLPFNTDLLKCVVTHFAVRRR